MNDLNIKFDESGQEDESDVVADAKSFKQLMLWGTDWTVETILTQLKKGKIELNPRYQRRNAWDLNKKSKLIESLIIGLPVPEVILAESKEKKGSYIVIDGKQRLLTIRQFCADENDDVFKNFKLRKLEILEDLNGINFKDIRDDPLLDDYQSAFENQTIRTIVIKNWPNEDVLYKIFHRLNTGSLELSPQELRQALHPGAFLDYVDEYSQESKEIKKVLKLKDPDPRMRDVELLIRYFAFKNYSNEYHGNLKDFLDKTCESLNVKYTSHKELIEDQAKEFAEAINTTFEIFGDDAFHKWDSDKYTKRFNRAVYEIMIYYFSISEIRNKSLENKDAVKRKFEDLCSTDLEFLQAFESSTKDIVRTTKRFSTWGNALSDILSLSISSPMQ
jgi:hypothetical protein